jgi:hypothetical protein
VYFAGLTGRVARCSNFVLTVSKSDQKEIKLEIELPPAGFARSMFFNRFRIEREDGFCLVQFGLITTSGLADSYSCIFTNEILLQNQATLLDYLNRTGRPIEKEPAPWKGAVMEKQTEVADIVTMAFRGRMAETCLYLFSLSAATRSRKGSTGIAVSVPGQPLALLRCTSEMQKQLIVALYEE